MDTTNIVGSVDLDRLNRLSFNDCLDGCNIVEDFEMAIEIKPPEHGKLNPFYPLFAFLKCKQCNTIMKFRHTGQFNAWDESPEETKRRLIHEHRLFCKPLNMIFPEVEINNLNKNCVEGFEGC